MSVQDRRPAATFSTVKADAATIYVATAPDRATNGRFFDENVRTLAFLTSSEIQNGHWTSSSRIDPGRYWVLLNASADFNLCYILDPGTFDPACSDGYSEVLPLVVPKPTIRFTTASTVYPFLGQVDLKLTAKPLGERLPYRLCYRTVKMVRRCLNGVIRGFSWDFPEDHSLSIRTRNLARFTTFTWYVGGVKVASRRVRVR